MRSTPAFGKRASTRAARGRDTDDDRGSSTASSSGDDGSRDAFCEYLIRAREASGKSLAEISTVTRIPRRSLECLEAGTFEKLPADVFVRGFLRSYARCVGLNEDEAVKRYARCGMTPAPVASPMADELANSMATLESSPVSGYRVSRGIEAKRAGTDASTTEATEASARDFDASDAESPVADPALRVPARVDDTERAEHQSARGASSQDRDQDQVRKQGRNQGRRKKKKRRNRKSAKAAGGGDTRRESNSAPTPVDAFEKSEPVHVAAARDQDESRRAEPAEPAKPAKPAKIEPAESKRDERGRQTDASAAADSERDSDRIADGDDRALDARADEDASSEITAEASDSRAAMPAPTLRIDDDCPEVADVEREEREAEREDAAWKNFLPPSLLDSGEGSHRGALTLAVIILVIVATLTMSYLLRQPSESGDGVTRIELPAVPPSSVSSPDSSPDSSPTTLDISS